MCNRAFLPFFLAATLTAPGQVVPFGALRVAVEVPAKTQLCFGDAHAICRRGEIRE